jgi:hypothetical protein
MNWGHQADNLRILRSQIKLLSTQRSTSATSSLSDQWTTRCAVRKAATSLSKLYLTGLLSLGSECHKPHNVVARSQVISLACCYLMRNCIKCCFPGGRGDVPGFDTLKYTAIVVFGSILPMLHALVPPLLMSTSATFGPFFFKEATGPIAPLTLNSLEVMTSRDAPNAIVISPLSLGIVSCILSATYFHIEQVFNVTVESSAGKCKGNKI